MALSRGQDASSPLLNSFNTLRFGNAVSMCFITVCKARTVSPQSKHHSRTEAATAQFNAPDKRVVDTSTQVAKQLRPFFRGEFNTYG